MHQNYTHIAHRDSLLPCMPTELLWLATGDIISVAACEREMVRPGGLSPPMAQALLVWGLLRPMSSESIADIENGVVGLGCSGDLSFDVAMALYVCMCRDTNMYVTIQVLKFHVLTTSEE